MLSLETGSYLGTIVKRIPFIVDNPECGRPLGELPATAELRSRNPTATVLELFHDAPLPQLGIASYDGVRDVYFGPVSGGCTSLGTDLSYGDDLRYQLHLGGSNRRTLIKYDLSMLPRTTKVAKAILALYVVEVDRKADLACRVFALKKPWSETFITHAGGLPTPPYTRGRPYPVGETVNWDELLATGKGDRHAEPIASLTFDKPGWVYIDVTPAVRNWLAGQWANHGLMLEMVKETGVAGKWDVLIRASDYNGEPAERPRLLLALADKPSAVPYQVREVQTDFQAALARARAEKKLVLCNILSAGSMTSRRLETHVLGAVPEMREFIDRNFVEVRIDGEKPGYKALLKGHGVRRLPTALILAGGKGGETTFQIIQPYDWGCDGGLPRSGFEFEQVYARHLQGILGAWRHSGRLPAVSPLASGRP